MPASPAGAMPLPTCLPRTTRTAVEEMIAPQARGLEVPDAAGIPAFMEQIQRNLHLFGRYGITMFAISGLDIALWDLAAKVKGVPLHRLIGDIKRTRIPAYASLLRIGKPELIAGECETARQLGYTAIKLHETTTPAVFAAREAIGAGIPLMVDMNCPMDGADAIAFAHACRDGRADVPRRAGLAAGGFCNAGRGARQGRARYRGGRECLHRASIQADDEGRRGQPRTALGHQGRRHHRIPESCCAGRRARRQDRSALALFRARPAGDAADCWRSATTASSKCST